MAKSDKIMVGIDDQVIELTGEAKETFLHNQAEIAARQALLEAEQSAKKDARESAIKKLAEIAGLTEEELASIL